MLQIGSAVVGGLVLFSCTFGQKVTSLPEEKRDLVEVFALETQQIEKFKEIPIEETSKETQASPSEAAEPNSKKEKNKKNKKNKKAKTKLKGLALPQATPLAEKSPPAPALTPLPEHSLKPEEGLYPPDYPEEFKEYDQKSRKVWENFRPIMIANETLKFSIKYFGLTCGVVTMSNLGYSMIGKKKTYHLKANMKSSDYYRYIYHLDDYIESYVDVETFLPVKYTLIQRESGQSVDDLQLFDWEKLKTFYWYERTKKGEVKKMEDAKYIPRWIQDSYSVIYFVRGLPLRPGDFYEFPIVTRAKVWILKAKVSGEETISLGDREVKAIKLKAETHFPGVLSKKGDILFWFSADPSHNLLKFSAKVKIGTVDGELMENGSGSK